MVHAFRRYLLLFCTLDQRFQRAFKLKQPSAGQASEASNLIYEVIFEVIYEASSLAPPGPAVGFSTATLIQGSFYATTSQRNSFKKNTKDVNL